MSIVIERNTSTLHCYSHKERGVRGTCSRTFPRATISDTQVACCTIDCCIREPQCVL